MIGPRWRLRSTMKGVPRGAASHTEWHQWRRDLFRRRQEERSGMGIKRDKIKRERSQIRRDSQLI